MVQSINRQGLNSLWVGCLVLALCGCGTTSTASMQDSANTSADEPAVAAAETQTDTHQPAPATVQAETPSTLAPPAAKEPPVYAKTDTASEATAELAPDPSADPSGANDTTAATDATDTADKAAASDTVDRAIKQPAATVFVCEDDNVVTEKPGRCQICNTVLSMTALANPDRATCPVDGNRIVDVYYGWVDGHAYAFDSPNCVLMMRKSPDWYLTEARKRAQSSAVSPPLAVPGG